MRCGGVLSGGLSSWGGNHYGWDGRIDYEASISSSFLFSYRSASSYSVRIDHTSERKSAILFNIVAEIPGRERTSIIRCLGTKRERIRIDMPERHDTGSHTIREKGKTLVSSGGPSR